MIHSHRLLLWIVFSAVCLSSPGLDRNQALAQNAADDESRARALVDQFYTSYSRKDLDGLMKLWSSRSPGIDAAKKTTQTAFDSVDAIDLKQLTVVKLAIEGEIATARIDAEMLATDKKTGKPASGFGKIHRVLHLIKEESVWRVLRESSAEEELAESLVEAKTKDQRERLLDNNKDLIDVALRQSIYDLSLRQRTQSNFAAAIDIALLAQGIAERIGDKLGIVITTRAIGISHAELTQYPEALEDFHKALSVAEDLGSKIQIAATLGNLGILYRRLSNYDLAMQYYRKSLAIVESLGDLRLIASNLNNVGNVYYFQGNYAQALEYLQKALAIKEPLGDKADIAVSLGNIGNIYQGMENYPKAVEYYKRTIALCEEVGDQLQLANNLNNIAGVYTMQKDYAGALANYEKCLGLFEAMGYKLGLSDSLVNIALVCNQTGNHQRALQNAERAVSIAREAGLRERLWMALQQQGNAFLALKKLEEARRAFDEAIAAIETLRSDVAGGEQEQQGFFRDKVAPYDAMVGLLIDQNKLEEGLSYAERKKARTLLDVLRSGRIEVTGALTAAEREQERALTGKLVSLNSQIAREDARPKPDQTRLASLKYDLQKARLDREAFDDGLYAAHPALKVKRGNAEPLKREDAARLLPDGRSALLEYVVTEDKTFLFVLSREQSHSARAPRGETVPTLSVYTIGIKSKELAQRTEAFRQQLARRDFRFGSSSRELWTLLLQPAQTQLANKSSLVIVPDDALWQLPFQALQSAPNRFLLEESAVCYAPSLTVLREMIKLEHGRASETSRRSSLLAIGNPTLGKQTVDRIRAANRGEALEPLPEAEKEVRALAQMYGKDSTEVFVGPDAREGRLKAEAHKFGVLHLATHGVIDDSNPMYSHLVLSQTEGDPNEDGLLEAWEMMNLELNADLVVLSACETARGRVTEGEGVIGMSWALFVAGCPTTVVSQWKVDSGSTTELMLEFHRNLRAASQSGSRGPKAARSLREAALKLLHSSEYRHPFYWAGFVVVGAGFD